jgi:hypothetical protein
MRNLMPIGPVGSRGMNQDQQQVRQSVSMPTGRIPGIDKPNKSTFDLNRRLGRSAAYGAKNPGSIENDPRYGLHRYGFRLPAGAQYDGPGEGVHNDGTQLDPSTLRGFGLGFEVGARTNDLSSRNTREIERQTNYLPFYPDVHYGVHEPEAWSTDSTTYVPLFGATNVAVLQKTENYSDVIVRVSLSAFLLPDEA